MTFDDLLIHTEQKLPTLRKVDGNLYTCKSIQRSLIMALSANSIFERVDTKTGMMAKKVPDSLKSSWMVNSVEADNYFNLTIENITEKQKHLSKSNRLFKPTP